MSAITQSQRSVRASGGTAEDIRDRNVASMLGWLHRSGTLSRAELTRLTGLSRSTVGDVIADLVALGFVSEGPAVVTGAGRPSGTVIPDPTTVAIAVNPEVDALNVGLVGFNGHVLRRARIPWTSRVTVDEVVTATSAVIAGMTSDENAPWRIIGAGVAVPGQVRLSDGLVREATHLGWSEEPLAAKLSVALGVPVQAANAAALALRAESAFGVGRDIDNLFYIIGGASGIGGGAVIDGRLAFGANGYACEVGHIFVADNNRLCDCGSIGCFETEVSRDGLLSVLGLSVAQAHLLAERLRESEDPAVTAVVDHYVTILRRVVGTVVNLFNPSTIIIGGFLAAVVDGVDPDDLVGESIRSAREGLRVQTDPSDVDVLLVGAAELAFAELIASPSSFGPRA